MYISIHMHVRDAHPRTYRATDGEVLSRRAERLLPALRLSVKLSPPRNESPCTRHVRDMREMNGHKCVRPAHHGVNGTRANGDDGLLGAGQQGRSHTAPRLHHARATAGSGADRGGEGGERRDKSRQGALAHWHAHAPAPQPYLGRALSSPAQRSTRRLSNRRQGAIAAVRGTPVGAALVQLGTPVGAAARMRLVASKVQGSSASAYPRNRCCRDVGGGGPVLNYLARAR